MEGELEDTGDMAGALVQAMPRGEMCGRGEPNVLSEQ